MGYYDDRAEEYRLLRAADAAVALILDGGLDDDCAHFVIVRLVATMLDASGFGSSDPAGTLGAAHDAVSDHEHLITRAQAEDEPLVRQVLHRMLLQAADADTGLQNGDLQEVTALGLDPFARRLRLLLRNLHRSGAAVARQIGQPAHQLHHWTGGRSKPGPAHRTALAEALGIHPRWLGAGRDGSVDIPLYRFRACPCGTGADLRADAIDDAEGFAGSGTGLWCTGCGQPHLISSDGWFFPVPITDNSRPSPLPFRAVRGGGGNIGGELDQPWPHALWVERPDPDRAGGPYRRPPILTEQPWTIAR